MADGAGLLPTDVACRVSLRVRDDYLAGNQKTGSVAFVDSGTLGINSTPSFKEFKAGGGIGFRYDLGFAPLRIDLAVPFDKPKGDPSYQIYIGVGQSF